MCRDKHNKQASKSPFFQRSKPPPPPIYPAARPSRSYSVSGWNTGGTSFTGLVVASPECGTGTMSSPSFPAVASSHRITSRAVNPQSNLVLPIKTQGKKGKLKVREPALPLSLVHRLAWWQPTRYPLLSQFHLVVPFDLVLDLLDPPFVAFDFLLLGAQAVLQRLH